MTNTSKQVYLRERYIYIFLMIASILLLFLLPKQVGEGMPRLFPSITLSAILLCSLLCLINCLRGNEKAVSFPKGSIKQLGLGIGLFIIYIFLIDYVGYYIMSAVFIFTSLYHLKVKKLSTNIIVAIVVPSAIYLLLDYLLGLSMPSGWIF